MVTPIAPRPTWRFIGGGEFRIPNCNDMGLELVWGADFWCNRHCRTSPVVLEGFWGQGWPKIGRKPAQKSEFIIAKEPLRVYAKRIFDRTHRLAVHWGGDFRIPNCHEMVLELVCGADFCCNRHCRTSPVVLEGFWGQVWRNTELPMKR